MQNANRSAASTPSASWNRVDKANAEVGLPLRLSVFYVPASQRHMKRTISLCTLCVSAVKRCLACDMTYNPKD
jgi:hypothetical protein